MLFHQCRIKKIFFVFLFLSLYLYSWAKLFEVNSYADSGPNTFRQHIIDANFVPGKDTISFAIADTVYFSTAAYPDITILPHIEDTLCIFGNGVTITTQITGRFLQINRPCEIYDMIFLGGQALITGGAIRTRSDAYLCKFFDCVFIENSAESGGAIYTACALILNHCIFDTNNSETGGGLNMRTCDSVVLDTCEFVDNIASVRGGAVLIDAGTLVVKDAIFYNSMGPFDQTITLSSTPSSPSCLSPPAEVLLDPGFTVIPPSMLLIEIY